MEFIALAPTTENHATCLYLNVDGAGFLIDPGIDPLAQGGEALPALESLANWPVDWILISHAHADHMGALPVLASRWPAARILCTRPTWDLTRLQLSRWATLLNERFYAGEIPEYPLFGVADVQDLDERVSFIKRGEALLLVGGYNPNPVRVGAFDAGHVLGSCGYLFEHGGKSLFYSGDTCGRPQSVIQGAVYPSGVDVLVSESTIAWSDRHCNLPRRTEIERLAQSIGEVASLDGSILIPVFNMGRAQEILFILHHLKRKGRIPPLPVHLGRSAWEIATLYDRHSVGDRRLLPDFLFSETLVDIFDGERAEGFDHGGSCIYLLPSGMLNEGSHAWLLARDILPCSINAVFFVGHSAERSPGKRLLRAGRGEELHFGDTKIPLHCRVESFLFSSHSNRDELLKMIDRCAPSELVILRGRKDSDRQLAEAACSRCPDLQCLFPAEGEALELGVSG